MCRAFEIFEMELHPELLQPEQLWLMMSDQVDMVEVCIVLHGLFV